MADTTSDYGITTVATNVEVRTTQRSKIISDTLVAMQVAGAGFPGFQAGEIVVSELEGGSNWRLIQRFGAYADAARWRISEERKKLLENLSSSELEKALCITDEMSHNIRADVATSIVSEVRPGKENEFLAWQTKIQSAQADFPGFSGSSIEAPATDHQGLWASVLRFNTPAQLENWFNSQERHSLLGELDEIVKSTRFAKVPTSFPGWFPHDAVTGEAPAKWKTALLVLMGLFPVIMLETLFIVPLIRDFHTPLRMFITMIASVAATTYLTMPLFIKWFRWWLLPGKNTSLKSELGGLALVLSIFVVEIGSFWTLIP